MNWQTLVEKLDKAVPPGSVTTYAEVSKWAYPGVPHRNQPVNSLLRGAANHGYATLTNRVVGSSGELADLPGGGRQRQREQLEAEGVSFLNDRVDLRRTPVVKLT